MSPVSGFVLTLLAATTIAVMVLGSPRPEGELPWPGVTRDVVVDRLAVDTALDGGDTPAGLARTPAGLLTILPLRLLPADYLTVSIAVVNVFCLASVVAGALILRPLSRLAGIVLCIGAPVTVAFSQAIFHGVTFLPLAVAIVWAWVLIERDWTVLPALLLAIAGVGRLWPFLLLLPLWLRDRRSIVYWTLGFATGLSLGGLALPGVTLDNSLASLVSGGNTWMAAAHNGSVASWIAQFGLTGALLAGSAVIAIMVLGLRRSPDLRTDLMWTLPLAILASPLAWLPYLIVLLPVALIAAETSTARVAVGAVAIIQLVGFRVMDHRLTTTLTLALIVTAVALSRIDIRSPRALLVDP